MNFCTFNSQYIAKRITKFCWQILFLSGVSNCWISITKYLRCQYGVTQVNLSVNVHLHISNKQQYVNNDQFIGNQCAKFQLNLAKQTIATAAFVKSPQSTSVLGRPIGGWRQKHRPETKVFRSDLTEAAVSQCKILLESGVVCWSYGNVQ